MWLPASRLSVRRGMLSSGRGNAPLYPVILAVYAAALLLFVCIWLVMPGSRLELLLVKASTGEVLWQAAADKGDEITLRYIHSVELSEVIEVFEIEDAGELVAMESRTRSFGAGLPHIRKGVTELKDGFYVMRELQEPVGNLHVQPSHLQSHTLEFQEEIIRLNTAPYAREHLVIEVRRMSRLKEWADG